MKKILFIMPYVPYTLASGRTQAFFNMIDHIRHFMNTAILLDTSHPDSCQRVKALQKIWPDVDFYLFKKSPQSEGLAIPEGYGIRQRWVYRQLVKVRASINRKIKRRLYPLDGLQRENTLTSSFYKALDTDYVEYVSQVARQGFDFIQVEFYELLSLIYVLPEDVVTLFVHHELRWIRNENEMAAFGKTSINDYVALQVTKDYELSALSRYKCIVTLTETDRDLLVNLMGNEKQHPVIYASPAVIQMHGGEVKPFVAAVTHRLTFVGSGAHYPNFDGLDWFCKDVVPFLCKSHFEFKLQVVGKWEPNVADLIKHRYPYVEMVGYVEDLPEFLRGSISVIPIRMGSGMRMKILDSVWANVPFVTTMKGVEGIDLHNGIDCLIADDAKSFAKCVITVSNDTSLQKQLVQNAFEHLLQLYEPSEMLKKRMNVYKRLLPDDYGGE